MLNCIKLEYPMYRRVKTILYDLLFKLKVARMRNWAINVEKEHINKVQLLALTSLEKQEIASVWGSLGLRIKPLYFQLFKTIERFDAKYLSDDLFFPWVIRALNPRKDSDTLENKGLYDIFFPCLKQPQYYIKRINGQFFDSRRENISFDVAIQILLLQDSFLIKPITGSCCGRNVKKVSGFQLENIERRKQILERMFLDYGENFIIQEVVIQISETEKFNPSSLNTIRISSLCINGKTSIVSSIFRCGQGKVDVDNGGAGGLMVGIASDGSLRDYAYDSDYNRYAATKTGVIFHGQKISAYGKLKKLVEEYHSKLLPTCGFAGWDFAINQNNEPIFIEVNLGFPGIQMEQMCTGPIFGDRTFEVVEYVKHHFPTEL